MNRNLYTGLRTRILTVPGIVYCTMWNNQVERLRDKHPDQLDFHKPAVFIQLIPSQVDSIGGGVQLFDPLLVKIHVVHQLFNNADEANEVNLDVFDIADEVHKKLQLYAVTGANYGTSPLNRTEVELDDDHDNIYHHIITYTTTWTDNSVKQPIGGYEKDPILKVALTAEKDSLPEPDVTIGVSSIAFGQVEIGNSDIEVIPISGTNITDPLILSASLPEVTLSLNNVDYSTMVRIVPVDKIVPLTTMYAKFTPTVAGAISGDINYGVPGINETITLTGEGTTP